MVKIREFKKSDLGQILEIWNDIVEQGDVFSQDSLLTLAEAQEYFKDQTFTGVAVQGDEVLGVYILHPNNIGRCNHLANTSYVVKKNTKGRGIGKKIVKHSMVIAKREGFRILQFNAVTVTNTKALELYRNLGFTQLGVIPGGFRDRENNYIDIIPHYIVLDESQDSCNMTYG